MVSVVQLHPKGERDALVDSLGRDLALADREVLARALDFADPLYAGQTLSTGENVWPHAIGLAASLASIGMDAASRASGILFAAPKYVAKTAISRSVAGVLWFNVTTEELIAVSAPPLPIS